MSLLSYSTDEYAWAELERKWAEECLSKMQCISENDKHKLLALRKIYGYSHIAFSELPKGTGMVEGVG